VFYKDETLKGIWQQAFISVFLLSISTINPYTEFLSCFVVFFRIFLIHRLSSTINQKVISDQCVYIKTFQTLAHSLAGRGGGDPIQTIGQALLYDFYYYRL
jgi:hypothetical protein